LSQSGGRAVAKAVESYPGRRFTFFADPAELPLEFYDDAV
jgi:hypothetical protein